jgi:hypothetical protein
MTVLSLSSTELRNRQRPLQPMPSESTVLLPAISLSAAASEVAGRSRRCAIPAAQRSSTEIVS